MNEKDEGAEPLVIVAHAVRTRGLKGELVADLLTDFPERFDETKTLVAVTADGKRQTLTLEDFWFQKDRVILKFEGYDSIEAATDLVGRDFAVPETERVPLEEGSYYQWELEGCQVQTVSGIGVGQVKEVLATGGVEILVIAGKEREILIPMAESIVVEIDVRNKRIVLDPPEGLLEL
jgi:16S rRNA processing protein RimM